MKVTMFDAQKYGAETAQGRRRTTVSLALTRKMETTLKNAVIAMKYLYCFMGGGD